RTSSEVQLQCAHWISRRYRNTRWAPDNAFSLCAGCHMWFSDHPTEFGRCAIGMRGEETYQRLREAAEQGRELAVEDEIDILEEPLAAVDVGSGGAVSVIGVPFRGATRQTRCWPFLRVGRFGRSYELA